MEVVDSRAGGHCIRCRAPLSTQVPAIVVSEPVVVAVFENGLFTYRGERAAICRSCASPAELAKATLSCICAGCEQPLLHGLNSPEVS
jgi:hypothetical protein